MIWQLERVYGLQTKAIMRGRAVYFGMVCVWVYVYYGLCMRCFAQANDPRYTLRFYRSPKENYNTFVT